MLKSKLSDRQKAQWKARRSQLKKYFVSKLTKVYGEEALGDDALTKRQIGQIANDMINHAKLFNLAKPMQLEYTKINEKYISKYFNRQIAFADASETVRQALGLTDPITEGFDDLDRIKKQRGLVGRVIRGAEKKDIRQEIINLFTLGKGMFSSSGRIGNRTWKVVNQNGKRVVVKRTDAEMKALYPDAPVGKLPKQGYQAFENNIDLFEQIKNDYEGDIEYKVDGKGALIELTIDGKKVTDTELSLYDEKTNSVIDKNGGLIKDIPYTERKAQSKRAQDFIKDIMKIVTSDSSYDAMDTGMTIMAMQQTMQAPIKRAANLEYASIQKGLKLLTTDGNT